VIPAEKNRIFGLDVLRATAILLVLVAHTWPSKSYVQWPHAFAVLGVELFFVLSGFLIGGILIRLAEEGRLREFSDVWGFWRRRWFRTLPNYYLFLALHLLWRTWVLGFPDQLRTNWEYLFFVQNFRHPPGYFFPETWSLAVEEWFYLLFPALLWIALRAFKRPLHAWMAVIAFFLIIPAGLRIWVAFSAGAPIDLPQLNTAREAWDAAPRKVVTLRLDVVMYGVICALIAASWPLLWRRLARWWPLGIALTAIATVSIGWNVPLDAAHRWSGLALWPVMAIGFALLLPQFARIQARKSWLARATSWVAKTSYALYLCHGLVLLAVTRWLGPRTEFGLQRHTSLWSLTALTLVFVVAGLVYRWFEKPMMDLRDGFERAKTGTLEQRIEAPPTPATNPRN
jgi:peptidoglycan/LPS O-acetylase OafA/YrhL